MKKRVLSLKILVDAKRARGGPRSARVGSSGVSCREEFYFDLIDAKSNATLAAAMLVILSNEECAAESYANLVALAVYAIVALQGLEFRSKPPPSPGQDPGVVRFQEEEVTTVEEFQAGRCTNTT